MRMTANIVVGDSLKDCIPGDLEFVENDSGSLLRVSFGNGEVVKDYRPEVFWIDNKNKLNADKAPWLLHLVSNDQDQKRVEVHLLDRGSRDLVLKWTSFYSSKYRRADILDLTCGDSEVTVAPSGQNPSSSSGQYKQEVKKSDENDAKRVRVLANTGVSQHGLGGSEGDLSISPSIQQAGSEPATQTQSRVTAECDDRNSDDNDVSDGKTTARVASEFKDAQNNQVGAVRQKLNSAMPATSGMDKDASVTLTTCPPEYLGDYENVPETTRVIFNNHIRDSIITCGLHFCLSFAMMLWYNSNWHDSNFITRLMNTDKIQPWRELFLANIAPTLRPMGGRDLAGAIRESIVDSILSCVPKSWYPPKNQLDELTKIVERYSVKAFKPLERLIPSRPQIPGAKIAAWFPPSFPRDLYYPEGIAHAFKQFQHGDSLDRDCSMASEQFASKHGCSLLTCGFFLQKNPQAVLDLDILDIDADQECVVTKNSPFYGFRKPQDEKEFISIFMFVCLTMVCTFQSGALLDEPGSIVRRGRLGLSLMLDRDGITMEMFLEEVLKDGGKSAVAGILTGEAWLYANFDYKKTKSMSPDLSRMALFTAINVILLSSMKHMMAYVANTSELGDAKFHVKNLQVKQETGRRRKSNKSRQ